MRNKPISLSVLYIGFLTFLSIVSVSFISMRIKYYSNEAIKKNTEYFKKAYLSAKKKEVKEDVLRIIKSINEYRKKEEIKAKDELKATLKNVYTTYLRLLSYPGKHNKHEIEAFLEYMFSENKEHYVTFFKNYESLYELLEKAGKINGLKKISIHRFEPKQNSITEMDGKLKYWGEIEGFLLCSKSISRCIFVFEPKDRIERSIKREILSYIVHFNMISRRNKYIFINKTNGEALILNNKIIDNGTKLWQISKNTSNNIKEIFEKELQACKKGGGFINYTWYEPKIGKTSKKTSYIGCYKPWKWIVGEGFYYSNVEAIISNLNSDIKYSTNIILKTIYTLVVIVFIIVVAAFLIFTKILDYRRIKVMKEFKESLKEGKKINLDVCKLKEIRDFAESINKAIDIFQQYEEEFIVALVNAIEMRDAYTQGHSQRVAYYAKVIAETLGFDEEKQEEIYRAGLLHDIGKIGIPDIILLKPGKLTAYEYEVIKYHPVFSFEIVSKISRFKNIAKYIRHHHERCDGSGYPDGLKCDEIEIEARILAIADVFDALTSKRVYRRRLWPEEAIEVIEKDKLDHEIVKRVKNKLIEVFLWEESREKKPHLSKVEEVRKELFDIDFKTGLKRRRVIINKAKELMLRKKPFILALLKINNFNSLIEHSFEKIDGVIYTLSQHLKSLLVKEGVSTEYISYAFDDAFLMLFRLDSVQELERFENIFDRLPQKLADKIDIKLNLSIKYKLFFEEFDSDLDSMLMQLKKE